MQWDLGPQGVALLAAMSLIFGLFTQVVFWHAASRWLWAIASVAAFAVGACISEVMFGWATAEELQPNIDGLSFDEVLIGFVLGGFAVLVARYLLYRQRHHPAAT